MLGLDKQLGERITAAVRDCTRHVLPPKEAQPLLWSARFGIDSVFSFGNNTTPPYLNPQEYNVTAGVWWNPRRSTALSAETNAHSFQQATWTTGPGGDPSAGFMQPFIDTDLGQEGEPFFNGKQGIVWPYAVVALQNDVPLLRNTAWSQPNNQCRITFALNNQPLPGYLRQFVGGNIEGPYLVSGGTTYFETQRYSTGPLPLAPVPGISLQSGDTLRMTLNWELLANAADARVQCFVVVRGWMW